MQVFSFAKLLLLFVGFVMPLLHVTCSIKLKSFESNVLPTRKDTQSGKKMKEEKTIKHALIIYWSLIYTNPFSKGIEQYQLASGVVHILGRWSNSTYVFVFGHFTGWFTPWSSTKVKESDNLHYPGSASSPPLWPKPYMKVPRSGASGLVASIPLDGSTIDCSYMFFGVDSLVW